MASCPDSRLGSVVNTKLVENMNDMTFDGMRTDGKTIGYFDVGGSFGHKPKYLNLTACKICLNFNWIVFLMTFLLSFVWCSSFLICTCMQVSQLFFCILFVMLFYMKNGSNTPYLCMEIQSHNMPFFIREISKAYLRARNGETISLRSTNLHINIASP